MNWLKIGTLIVTVGTGAVVILQWKSNGFFVNSILISISIISLCIWVYEVTRPDEISRTIQQLKTNPNNHKQILGTIASFALTEVHFQDIKGELLKNKGWPGTNEVEMKMYYLDLLTLLIKKLPNQTLSDDQTRKELFLYSNLSHIINTDDPRFSSLIFPEIKGLIDSYIKYVKTDELQKHESEIITLVKSIQPNGRNEELNDFLRTRLTRERRKQLYVILQGERANLDHSLDQFKSKVKAWL